MWSGASRSAAIAAVGKSGQTPIGKEISEAFEKMTRDHSLVWSLS
jgi:hypothetical protein